MEEPELPLGYVDLISIVGETNRCPGGKRAISRLAHTMHIGAAHRVLDVGSNTGFTSIELASITGCRVDGVEINPGAVAEAKRTATALPSRVAERIAFHHGDVRSMPWDEDTFDAVVCGGALGFINDRQSAFREIRRVLRPLGMVSITHLYYRRAPSRELSGRLAEILGFPVPGWGWDEWLAELAPPDWEMYHLDRRPLTARSADVVDAYVRELSGSNRMKALPAATRDRVREQWRTTCQVFNDNHRHLGVMELVLRLPVIADIPEQPELFLEPGAFDPHFTHAFIPSTESENR
ncbi:class I SAM-dependent methyltransferase [Streptomyces sp. NPDC093109]|uniref:class I SAM-dependent methyltransferase n=1 Tax=Streptomyces sp. NPDC093109 TaxID=3154977 RepID=UPI00344B1BC6